MLLLSPLRFPSPAGACEGAMADVQHDEPVPELKEDVGGEVSYRFSPTPGRAVCSFRVSDEFFWMRGVIRVVLLFGEI